MHFLILGRSVRLNEKNLKKNSQEGSALRAWYPSIIALDQETTRHEPKINLPEKLVDVIVKLRQCGEKGSTTENLCSYYAYFPD